MQDTIHRVERHYTRGDLVQAIASVLRESGKDPERPSITDLAAVDEFHIRGRDATLELARRAGFAADERVLDIGCGLGGSARYLASEHRCRVTGIDVTKAYIEAASELTKRVGLADHVDYRLADANELPFEDGSFDVVWTEHVQMNVQDKRRFYGGIARVLAPGGRLVFHDLFLGPAGGPSFPVPWAEEASLSFLATPDAVRQVIEGVGLRVTDWADRTQVSADWLAERLSAPPPALGVHMLMGSNARTKFDNVLSALREGRLAVVQAVATKA